jgi:hypothetical protein
MSFDVLPPRLRNPKRETWFPEIQKENKGLLGRSTPLAKCYRGIGDAAGSTSKISVQRVVLPLKSVSLRERLACQFRWYGTRHY